MPRHRFDMPILWSERGQGPLGTASYDLGSESEVEPVMGNLVVNSVCWAVKVLEINF